MSGQVNFLTQLEYIRRQGVPAMPSTLLGTKRTADAGLNGLDLALFSRPVKKMATGNGAPGSSFVTSWMANTIAAHKRSQEAELKALLALQARKSAQLVNSLASSNQSLLLQARDRQYPASNFPVLPKSFAGNVAATVATKSGVSNPQAQRPGLSPSFLKSTSTSSPKSVCIKTLEYALGKETMPAKTAPVTQQAPKPTKVEVATKIPCMPLSIDEDPNWLSGFHCFVRKELVEVCFATSDDVRYRHMNHKVVLNQLGLRCRHCFASGGLHDEDRAPRSVAFPSSIGQIYQSFTMMVREHFGSCTNIPESLREEFMTLKKGKTAQGAINSKAYWEYAAKAMGMKDSQSGIILTEETQATAKKTPPYGSTTAHKASPPVMLVEQHNKPVAKSEYTFKLLEQVQRVQLRPEECRGNRKTLKSGLPGFACIHCSQVGRMGHSRVFPVKKRTLPIKLEDMYQHLVRCTVCPAAIKKELKARRDEGLKVVEEERELYDVVWARLKKRRLRSPVIPASTSTVSS